jgi:hypothetical protein
MKAPEKIYLTSDEKKSYVFTQKRSDGMGVEYTRTDAFIEKACEWLKKNGCGYWLDDSALSNKDLIEEFKKYMKGE